MQLTVHKMESNTLLEVTPLHNNYKPRLLFMGLKRLVSFSS